MTGRGWRTRAWRPARTCSESKSPSRQSGSCRIDARVEAAVTGGVGQAIQRYRAGPPFGTFTRNETEYGAFLNPLPQRSDGPRHHPREWCVSRAGGFSRDAEDRRDDRVGDVVHDPGALGRGGAERAEPREGPGQPYPAGVHPERWLVPAGERCLRVRVQGQGGPDGRRPQGVRAPGRLVPRRQRRVRDGVEEQDEVRNRAPVTRRPMRLFVVVPVAVALVAGAVVSVRPLVVSQPARSSLWTERSPLPRLDVGILAPDWVRIARALRPSRDRGSPAGRLRPAPARRGCARRPGAALARCAPSRAQGSRRRAAAAVSARSTATIALVATPRAGEPRLRRRRRARPPRARRQTAALALARLAVGVHQGRLGLGLVLADTALLLVPATVLDALLPGTVVPVLREALRVLRRRGREPQGREQRRRHDHHADLPHHVKILLPLRRTTPGDGDADHRIVAGEGSGTPRTPSRSW